MRLLPRERLWRDWSRVRPELHGPQQHNPSRCRSLPGVVV